MFASNFWLIKIPQPDGILLSIWSHHSSATDLRTTGVIVLHPGRTRIWNSFSIISKKNSKSSSLNWQFPHGWESWSKKGKMKLLRLPTITWRTLLGKETGRNTQKHFQGQTGRVQIIWPQEISSRGQSELQKCDWGHKGDYLCMRVCNEVNKTVLNYKNLTQRSIATNVKPIGDDAEPKKIMWQF